MGAFLNRFRDITRDYREASLEKRIAAVPALIEDLKKPADADDAWSLLWDLAGDQHEDVRAAFIPHLQEIQHIRGEGTDACPTGLRNLLANNPLLVDSCAADKSFMDQLPNLAPHLYQGTVVEIVKNAVTRHGNAKLVARHLPELAPYVFGDKLTDLVAQAAKRRDNGDLVVQDLDELARNTRLIDADLVRGLIDAGCPSALPDLLLAEASKGDDRKQAQSLKAEPSIVTAQPDFLPVGP